MYGPEHYKQVEVSKIKNSQGIKISTVLELYDGNPLQVIVNLEGPVPPDSTLIFYDLSEALQAGNGDPQWGARLIANVYNSSDRTGKDYLINGKVQVEDVPRLMVIK